MQATSANREVTVERRGGAPSLRGTLVSVDENQVVVRSDLGATHDLPWHTVRSVSPARPDVDRYLDRAEQLWRATTRVERGDTELAEPILAALYETIGNASTETTLVIAEGLLRCRIARGDQVGAVMPFLDTVRLRRRGITTSAYARLEPIIDTDTLLCPWLAPVLPTGPALRRLHAELTARAFPEPVSGVLAKLYRAAVEVEPDGRVIVPTELPEVPTNGEAASHPGVQLVRDTLRAAMSVPDAIASMRRLRTNADWRGAWANFALGVSALATREPDRVVSGVLDVLLVPAGHGSTQAWLSGAALLIASAAMEARGDSSSAGALRAELRSGHPNHPFVLHERLSVRGATSAPSASPGFTPGRAPVTAPASSPDAHPSSSLETR